MERQYTTWKHTLDQIWSAPSPDWRAATRLLAEIAAEGRDDELRRAAAQVLPFLRHVSATRGGRVSPDAARRRLSMVRDVLYTRTAPRFGRRGAAKTLTADERYRQMLGLPLGRHLSPNEIHQAFKHAAKSLHPDAGGDPRAFLELAAAREALMHPGSKRGE
jgi:hypothetical protein